MLTQTARKVPAQKHCQQFLCAKKAHNPTKHTVHAAGDDSYPTTHLFSTFSVVCGTDCPTAWLGQHKLWAVVCKSDWYAFSLERGSKNHNLHVQGVMSCRIYNTAAGCTLLRDLLKSYLNSDGSQGVKITVKACAACVSHLCCTTCGCTPNHTNIITTC